MIGIILNEPHAARLTAALKRRGIDTRMEGEFDAASGHMNYSIWVVDEDRIPVAMEVYARFVEEPTSAEFDTPVLEVQEEVVVEEKIVVPKKTPFTNFMLTLCCLLFVLNFLEQTAFSKVSKNALTPLQMSLLYDVPRPLEELEKIVEQYALKPGQPVPVEAEAKLAALDQIPFWRGISSWGLQKLKGQDTSLDEGPLFEKIRQGEIWRLASPILLHGDILHILFNMLWLWVLGRPIEQRIGMGRTILLTVLCAVISNTAQYLMSGPFFLGYSGVVMGFAGFIWMRERKAPWEGYPVQRSTLLFLAIFVGAIFALQVGAMFVDLVFGKQFPLQIANTAHIVGALVGAFLGSKAFFAEQVRL